MSTLMTQARSRVPRFAEAAVERARLTVVPRRPQTAPRVPFVVLVSMMLVGGVVGLLLFNTSLQQASFTTTALEEKASALDAKKQALQMELARLRDPQRVAARAKKIGMVPAASPAFIRLSDGKVLGTPMPADASDAIRIGPPPVRKPADLTPPPVIVEPTVPSTTSTTTSTTAARGQDGRDGHRSRDRAQDRRDGNQRDTAAASAEPGPGTGTKNKQHRRQG